MTSRWGVRFAGLATHCSTAILLLACPQLVEAARLAFDPKELLNIFKRIEQNNVLDLPYKTPSIQ